MIKTFPVLEDELLEEESAGRSFAEEPLEEGDDDDGDDDKEFDTWRGPDSCWVMGPVEPAKGGVTAEVLSVVN